MPTTQVASVPVFDFGAPVGAVPVRATGSVLFANAAPANADIVTVIDGAGKSVTFEFNSGSVTAGRIKVANGANVGAAATNLAAAINKQRDLGKLDVTATVDTATVNLVQDFFGASGNTTITATFATGANVTATSFTGGVDGVAKCDVIKLRAMEGGKLDLLFENADGENAITVSAQVSTNGTHFRATTADDNLAAVQGVSVPVKQTRSYTIGLRPEIDAVLRIVATGGARGTVQIRGEQCKFQLLKV
jgi:hypothetical protein